jgi:uncharacterized protein (TIGR01244 family)
MTGHCTNEMELATPNRGTLRRYDIDAHLTLAGQPQAEDWDRLAAEGFEVVVNMRSDPERAAVQQRVAEATGLRYIHLPLPAYELEPAHLAAFHALMQAETGRVYLHCRSAARVALMWLLERTVYDGWSQEQAAATLRRAGYDEDAMETFAFCAADYFERAGAAQLT